MKIKLRLMKGAARMKQACGSLGLIKVGLGIALLTTLVGCVGVVDEGYGGDVVVAQPDLFLFGGGYDRGRDVRDYGRRGGESRAFAHSDGGGHGGGGHGGRR